MVANLQPCAKQLKLIGKMAEVEIEKGLDVKQAFAEMLDDPTVQLNHKKSLRNRMNNNKITSDKMVELLKANGYRCIQDQVFIKE